MPTATLETRLRDLATAIGTDVKTLRTFLTGSASGDLSALNTAAKGNIVAALNEVRAAALAAAASGGAAIDDTGPHANSVYSSQKTTDAIAAAIQALVGAGTPAALDTLAEVAAQLASDETAAAALTTAVGLRVRVDAVQGFTAPQKAQARANIGTDITSAEIGDPSTDFAAAYNTAKA